MVTGVLGFDIFLLDVTNQFLLACVARTFYKRLHFEVNFSMFESLSY